MDEIWCGVEIEDAGLRLLSIVCKGIINRKFCSSVLELSCKGYYGSSGTSCFLKLIIIISVIEEFIVL